MFDGVAQNDARQQRFTRWADLEKLGDRARACVPENYGDFDDRNARRPAIAETVLRDRRRRVQMLDRVIGVTDPTGPGVRCHTRCI